MRQCNSTPAHSSGKWRVRYPEINVLKKTHHIGQPPRAGGNTITPPYNSKNGRIFLHPGVATPTPDFESAFTAIREPVTGKLFGPRRRRFGNSGVSLVSSRGRAAWPGLTPRSWRRVLATYAHSDKAKAPDVAASCTQASRLLL